MHLIAPTGVTCFVSSESNVSNKVYSPLVSFRLISILGVEFRMP